MKKQFLQMACIAGLSCAMVVTGCGNQKGTAQKDAVQQESSTSKADQEAAKKVADLIDAIYVQERTDETDQQCADAKAAWDTLTDTQKALVEGEYADPDYFGRDTGDASKDDPRNGDDIGDKELLVVSFGTSFNDSRVADIGGIENTLEKAFPDWSVRRAFTAQIIINHIQARDGEKIDNVQQAMERAVANGVKTLVVQPTHLMHGAEYDELMQVVNSYKEKIDNIQVAEPLLGQVGKAATDINEDKKTVAEAVVAETVADTEYASLAEAKEAKTAFVFMGHGTSHTAKITYSQMQAQMQNLQYDNVFIGTVEGEPEETACESVIEAVKKAGYQQVILRPLMVVAGDHANNDMAGEEADSWLSQFKAANAFEKVDTQISGLGRISAVQDLYIAHSKAVMDKEGKETADTRTTTSDLKDGEYQAKFTTDSSMFHINEAYKDLGTLTVKDGKMTMHITLTSKNIVNLYVGTTDEVESHKDDILEPVVDTVKYDDGTTEEVYGFDVPVPALDQEFDLALVGTKGKWYDHKVCVSLEK